MFDLHDLYTPVCDPEYHVKLQKAGGFYEKIEKAFSPAFMDEFWNAHMELTEQERSLSYQEGFQAGVLFAVRAFLALPGGLARGPLGL